MNHDVILRTLIGESPAICRVRALIARVAPTTLPVLIQGPTGSGKELAARALHDASGRPGRFVAFNVCAIADTMFEDAVFGHVRGAFTGAITDSPGYLAEADRGTVLFDEISGLTLPAQAKLLRAIETREFRPVGARVDRRSEFRVVAATNERLDDLAGERRFRADLMHRLSAVVIDMPALADRLEDVPVLAQHFVEHGAGYGSHAVTLASCAMATLQQYDWPGNVRELRNVIERAAALSETPILDARAIATAIPPRGSAQPASDEAALRRWQLLELLQRFEWDTTRVATHLKVDRKTVYRRMKQLGIRTPKWVARWPVEPLSPVPLS